MPRDLPFAIGRLMVNFDHEYNIRGADGKLRAPRVRSRPRLADRTALIPARSPKELRAAMKQCGFNLGGGYGSWKHTTFASGTWATSRRRI